MMAAQRQRQTGLSILRRLSPATPDEDHVSPADGETNSTQPSDFVKCVNKEACASQCCSFQDLCTGPRDQGVGHKEKLRKCSV